MTPWLCLAAGGVLGTFARYGLFLALPRAGSASFPYATFAANLTGSFLIGYFSSAALTGLRIGPDARLFLTAGFCGAFTTFSALMLETAQMTHAGQASKAVFYAAASLVLGFLLFHAGARAGGA